MGCECRSSITVLLLLAQLPHFLLHCHLSSAAAPLINGGSTGAADGGPNKGSASGDCTYRDILLDCSQATALQDVIEDIKQQSSGKGTRAAAAAAAGGTWIPSLSCVNNETADLKCSCADNGTCFITKIQLAGNMLDGFISPSIGLLKTLRIIDLSKNQLTGSIPDSLTKLQSLQGLDLSKNQLTGSIPDSLIKLQSLQWLDLSYNNLDGSIPQNLKGLESLAHLDLSTNQLSGFIPASISDCRNLTFINLGSNFLDGPIPPTLGTLSSLKALAFSSNNLTGHLPPDLGKLSNLNFLLLDDNNLEGPLPDRLGDLVNLQYLALTSNSFTKEMPKTYEKLVNLNEFEVGGNYLSGNIPDYLGKWKNLTRLNLLGNNFEGKLSAEIFGLQNLEVLWISDVSNTRFSFPENEVKMENIVSMILRNCSISGSIPKYIGNWSRLTYLDLSFNKLSGPIPDSLGILYKLFLTRNMLHGPLPSWITEKPETYPIADLSYNDFTETEAKMASGIVDVKIQPTRVTISQMLKQKCDRKHSSSLYINCGGEEVTVGKHRYQKDTATASFNHSPSGDWAYSFSGDYLLTRNDASTLVRNLICEVSSPEAKLDNNFRLAPVALTYYGLCLRKGKYTVTLRFAETLFSKKEDHSSVGKRVFDIYIQGIRVTKGTDLNIKKLPGPENEGKQEHFTAKVHDGSLVIHFFWAGKGSLYNPPYLNGPLVSAISITRVPRKLYPWEIALITIGCILAVLLLLALMWRLGWIGDRELRETKINIGERTFTLKKIIDATQKFSSNKEIGRGRSGIVYKADLLPNLTVAVKKLLSHSKAIGEIASEVYANKALNLKHDNLVQLLATYSKNRLHLIIYEYMEIGSLAKALFGPNPTVQLNWEARFIICKGVAKGLKYLHERNPPIIHRNIKASNILLDASSNPKISDFGLAKLYEEENPFIAIGAGEQFLYMAPEYVTRRAMTVKVDVYSFGILLLEIVSGKPNADYRVNQETVFLLDTASNLHARGRLGELVDSRLVHYDYEQANIVLKLAMMCTEQSPLLRPVMSQVVSVFEGEKTVEQISKEIAPSA